MKIRFLQPWSTYKPGDTMDTESWPTICRLCGVHKVAELVGDEFILVPMSALQPPKPEPAPEDKAVVEAPRDKMVRRARKSKGANA